MQHYNRGRGGTTFRRFNRELKLNHHHIGELFEPPTDFTIAEEVPTNRSWHVDFGRLWQRLTVDYTTNMEGKKSSRIQNSTI